MRGKAADQKDYQIAFFLLLKIFQTNYYYKMGRDRIYYNPIRSGVGWIAYLHGSFENAELEQCEKLIKSGDVVMDIGANIGSHSVYFSSLAPNGIIYSIEPSRLTFEYLLKNIKRIENVIPLSLALSNTNGIAKFYECDNDVMSGLKDTERSYVSYVNKVPVVKADSLVKMLDLQNLDFVKIDVEGLESQVIEGFRETLVKFKPVIFCEIYSGTNSNPDPEGTISLIGSLGYTVFVLKANQLMPYERHDDRYHNYFFIPVK
jgi:FkbM family methyltransferase